MRTLGLDRIDARHRRRHRVWAGEWIQPQFNGTLRLVLKQGGSRVTGDVVSFTGMLDFQYTGRLEGTINGDVVTLRQPTGRLRLELTANGDEMTGIGSTRAGNPAITLRR